MLPTSKTSFIILDVSVLQQDHENIHRLYSIQLEKPYFHKEIKNHIFSIKKRIQPRYQ